MRRPRATTTVIGLVAIAAIASSIGVSVALAARTGATTVTVNLKATRQAIQGFGTSQRVWDEPHISKAATTSIPANAQTEILTALYRRLGLTIVRNSLNSGIENSKGAPFNFSATFVDAQADFVKQAKRYGLRTFFPSPVYLEDWMQADDPSGYVDYAMAVLRRFKQDGVEPPLYSPINEPAVSHDFPLQWMHDVVLQLGQRLRAAGFKTKLVIPDDENPEDAYRRALAVLQDPAARKYVGAIAFHIYSGSPDDWPKLKALASKYGLPLWMTEYQSDSYTDWASSLDWAQKMHQLLVDGVGAIDYLWGFFGSWVSTDTMVSIHFDNGQFVSWSPTPIYWITGQYSRYVRPGFRRVDATPATGSVLTTAYIGPKRAIVIVTNPSGSSQSIRVRITGGKVKGVVRPVQSTASEHWQSVRPIAVRSGSFSTTVPAESMTTFVATR